MNSHIQMPKCVLKQFANEDNVLFYYNFKDGHIAKSSAKYINTEKNYYSDEMEMFFNRNIETPFSKVIEEIKKPNRVFFDETKVRSIYNFVNALVARSSIVENQLNTNSSAYQLIPKEQKRNDFRAWFAFNSICKNGGVIEDCRFTLGVNDSLIPFVLPNSGLYEFEYGNEVLLNMPITPFRSIIFILGKKSKFIDDNGIIPLCFKLKAVMTLNEKAFTEECQYNRLSVASGSKNELERIVTKCQKVIDYELRS